MKIKRRKEPHHCHIAVISRTRCTTKRFPRVPLASVFEIYSYSNDYTIIIVVDGDYQAIVIQCFIARIHHQPWIKSKQS